MGVEEKWLKTTYGTSHPNLKKTQTLVLTVALMRLEIIGVILSNFFSKASYLDSVIEKDTVHGFSDHIHTTK